MDAAPPARRSDRLPVGLALLACAAFYVAALDPALYLWGDNAHYIIVAKALATGQGLRDIHTPGSPPFAFPIPLFPLALAPIVAVFDYDLVPLKLFVALTGVLAVHAAHRLFRTLVDPARATLLAALVAVSPQVVSFSHQVMTEVPYIALSLTALLYTARYARAPGWRCRDGATLALVLAAALLTRSLGVALLLAAVAYLALEGAGGVGTRARKALLTGGVCVAAWLVASAPVLGNVQYVREFREGNAGAPEGDIGLVPRLAARVAANVREYAVAVPETVLYSAYEWESRAVGAAILVVLAAGLALAVARRRSPLEYYLAAYAAVLLLYEPSNSGNLRRYVVPLVPLALYYFALGVEALWELARRAAGRAAHARPLARLLPALPLALLALANLADAAQASVLRREPEMFDYDRYTDADGYRRMGEWVRAHTPAGSVVAASNTYIFHFWSRRLTVWLPDVPPGGEAGVAAAARAQRLAFVAVDSATLAARGPLPTALARDTAAFALVYDAGWNRVYAVRPTRASPR